MQSLHLNRMIVRYLEGGYSENMLTSSSLNFEEKRKIKRMYFGDTPDWFFERLKRMEIA